MRHFILVFILIFRSSVFYGQAHLANVPESIIEYFEHLGLHETVNVGVTLNGQTTIGIQFENLVGRPNIKVVLTDELILITEGLENYPDISQDLHFLEQAVSEVNVSANALLFLTTARSGDNTGRIIESETSPLPPRISSPTMADMIGPNGNRTVISRANGFGYEIVNAFQTVDVLKSAGVSISAYTEEGNLVLDPEAVVVDYDSFELGLIQGQILGLGTELTALHEVFGLRTRSQSNRFTSPTSIITLTGMKSTPTTEALQTFLMLRLSFIEVPGAEFSERPISISGTVTDDLTTGPRVIFYEPVPPAIFDFQSFRFIDELDFEVATANNLDNVALVACSDCSGIFGLDIPAGVSDVSGDFPEKWNPYVFQSEGGSLGFSGFEIKRTGGNSYEIRDANGTKTHSGTLEVGSIYFGLEDLESQLRSNFQSTAEVYDIIEAGRFGVESIENLLEGNDNVSDLFTSGNLDQRAAAFNDAGLFLRGSLNGFNFNNGFIPSLTHFDVPVLNLDQGFFRTGTTGGGGNDLFGQVSRPVSRFDRFSHGSRLISREMLPGSESYGSLFETLSSDPDEQSHLKRVLEQSLVLDGADQAILQGSYGSAAEVSSDFSRSDIYPYLKLVNEMAGLQMSDAVRLGGFESDTSLEEVWIAQLKSTDASMLDGILNKLSAFQQAHGLEGSVVSLVPRFSFDMDIRPRGRVSGGLLDLNQLTYKVDLSLQNVLIQLGIDRDCDGIGEEAVPLTPAEESFLKDAWAQDTDGDGEVDSGFILWLQDRMEMAEKRIALALYTGEHSSYSRANTVVGLMAVGEWYKRQVGSGHLALSEEWDGFLESDDLVKRGLASQVVYPTIDIAGHDAGSLSMALSSVTSLAVSHSHVDVRSSWHALELEEEVEDLTDIASQANTGGSLSIEGGRFISLSAFEHNEESLAYGTEYWYKSTLVNGAGVGRGNMRVDFEVSTDRDMAWFHVYRWDVSSIAAEGSERMVFNFRPLTTGMHTLRVRVDGQTVHSQSFNVLADNESILDREAYCQNTSIQDITVTTNTQTTISAGNIVYSGTIQSGSRLILNATNSIKLTPGFHARRGGQLRTFMVSCQVLASGPSVFTRDVILH